MFVMSPPPHHLQIIYPITVCLLQVESLMEIHQRDVPVFCIPRTVQRRRPMSQRVIREKMGLILYRRLKKRG
ncbi:hypothetical protein GDO81_023314 [Engystomops pustulosus]|uniref:Uncharacterized protein n=1 Tax=Engystomops pustulosus TaxID=76066 RepID=A0AAV6YMF7_ENGPU|nr:hypothetical protein GDO81_023314 [Engystomops pustulosus]